MQRITVFSGTFVEIIIFIIKRSNVISDVKAYRTALSLLQFIFSTLYRKMAMKCDIFKNHNFSNFNLKNSKKRDFLKDHK